MYFGDRFFFMKDGRIRCSGGSEVFEENIVRDIYGVFAKIVENDGEKFIHYYKGDKQ